MNNLEKAKELKYLIEQNNIYLKKDKSISVQRTLKISNKIAIHFTKELLEEMKEDLFFFEKLHKGYIRYSGAKWIKENISPEAREARLNKEKIKINREVIKICEEILQ